MNLYLVMDKFRTSFIEDFEPGFRKCLAGFQFGTQANLLPGAEPGPIAPERHMKS